MAKLILKFNNTEYSIDESALATATNALKSHLSTTMSGSGAKVSLGGVSYNIDSTKLSTATNNFIPHLGTIAGTGAEVVVNGTKYSVDSTKLSGAVSELSTAFDNLSGGATPDTPAEERLEGDGAEYYTLAPTALTFRSTEPLNEFSELKINGKTVDPSNYTLEEGSTIVTLPIDYLKTLDVGLYDISVVSANKTTDGHFTVAAPELNEYGFYYNQPYLVNMGNSAMGFMFYSDGTMSAIQGAFGNLEIQLLTYAVNDGVIIVSNGCTGVVQENGNKIYSPELSLDFTIVERSFYSDAEYIYIPIWVGDIIVSVDAYVIDKTKTSYKTLAGNIDGVVVDIISLYENCENLTEAILPYGISTIGLGAFQGCINLKSVTIPSSAKRIHDRAFSECNSLMNITFDGTTMQWNAMSKGYKWNQNTPDYTIHCTDGDIAKNGTITYYNN